MTQRRNENISASGWHVERFQAGLSFNHVSPNVFFHGTKRRLHKMLVSLEFH